ncbi:hydroxyethylthiazole kinase [Bacillus sp. B1-b2]|nr:hydroxyethylthiazole kinase [Bacillus sp. B1-b2]KAB7673125.1 hydroxyethylthiazole kinase [Bacillus sp. B1-b2]
MTKVNIEAITGILTRIREKVPLIHNITNVVVTNFTANGLLALGASPVMAYAQEEVEEMATIADALVLNIGTLTRENVESMILAGKAANIAGTPVVLDPVGAGATTYRTQSVHRILEEVNVSLIRGNAAEIANVAGIQATMRGVDSVMEQDNLTVAYKAAKLLEIPVIITGKEDIVTDGKVAFSLGNGSHMLTKVTGAGCLLTSILGAFIAVEEDVLVASLAGITTYGIAAELAYEKTGENPGSFQVELLNQLARISELDIQKRMNINRSEGVSI